MTGRLDREWVMARLKEFRSAPPWGRLSSSAAGCKRGLVFGTVITLRAAELVTLRWDSIDFAHGRLHVRRLKAGSESVHPLSGRELRALRRLKREQDPASPSIFTSERGAPFTTAGFRKMVARLGVVADIDFPVHPHMLRHACGFKLANDGVDTRSLQAYLGHRNIQHAVRYTELSPTRFKHFWHDRSVPQRPEARIAARATCADVARTDDDDLTTIGRLSLFSDVQGRRIEYPQAEDIPECTCCSWGKVPR